MIEMLIEIFVIKIGGADIRDLLTEICMIEICVKTIYVRCDQQHMCDRDACSPQVEQSIRFSEL